MSTIADFSQINVLSKRNLSNIFLVTNNQDWAVNTGGGSSIAIGSSALDGIDPAIAFSNSVFLGTQATINPAATQNIVSSIAIGCDANVIKSNDFILGGYNRVAIGNMNPQYALHITNVTDSASVHICNAVMYLDDISTPSEMTNPPSTGGVFYVESGIPKFKSSSMSGSIALSAKNNGITTLSLASGATFASATVTNAAIHSNSIIELQRKGIITDASTIGILSLSVSEGSFTIYSTVAADVGQIQYTIS